MGREYPFLAASLDAIAYDPVRKGMSLRDAFRLCHGELHGDDKELLRRLFLFNDIKNIVYMHFRQRVRQGDCLYPAYYIEEHYQECRRDPLMAFGFVQRWWELKAAGIRYLPNLPETDVLTTFFYEGLESVIPPGFVRDWYMFELELRNFTVALALERGRADAQGIEIKEKLIPFGWVYDEISRGAKAGKDVGREGGWAEQVREETGGVRRSELICERARWDWIDEHLGSDQCSADVVYAHLIRLWSVERWEELTRQGGTERLDSIVDTMRRSIRFAVEFDGAAGHT